MGVDAQAVAPAGELLTEAQIAETLYAGLAGRFDGARLLVLIPDHTRTMPLHRLFRLLLDLLRGTQQLDFMVALGTHPPLTESALHKLVGITAEERSADYAHVGLLMSGTTPARWRSSVPSRAIRSRSWLVNAGIRRWATMCRCASTGESSITITS